MIEWNTVLPTVVVAFIAAGGGWLTTKIQHRGKPENALIDQLQEETSRHAKRIDSLEAEQTKAKKRERIRDDYINKLRRHIEDGNPPPPPVWPDGLYD